MAINNQCKCDVVKHSRMKASGRSIIFWKHTNPKTSAKINNVGTLPSIPTVRQQGSSAGTHGVENRKSTS